MKVCIVTPNEDYVTQAGARIRYRRLVEPLRRLGHDLSMRPIGSIRSREDFDADVLLLSKCHDARAALVTRRARRLGIPVGIDLFDDYFSQKGDPRFARLRAWLAAMTETCDFILCSTPAMKAVAAAQAPGLPSHVMNDPFERFDAGALATLLAQKRERVAATGVLEIAWFGTGDNPHFPVGLADVVAFSDQLRALTRAGQPVVLHILTNVRAMSPDALAALARLPVRHTLATWSEAAEAALLERCYAAFLPVNAQPFSVAKSLNRAVTALTAGTQVLSVGYPLYALFADFIYRDPRALVADAGAGEARLRPETLGAFADLLRTLADPQQEASQLADFLAGVPAPARLTEPDIFAAVVHGRESGVAVHDCARTLGALSVASPLMGQPLDYDVRMVAGAEGLDVLLHSRLVGRIGEDRLLPDTGVDGPYRRIRMDEGGPAHALDLCRLPHSSLQAVAQAAAHTPILEQVAGMLHRLFPGVPLILSEDFRLGWASPPGFPGGPVADGTMTIGPMTVASGNAADVVA